VQICGRFFSRVKTRLSRLAAKAAAFLLMASFGVPASAYTADGPRIWDHQGGEVKLYGVNWFGSETPDHVVHGLWVRNWSDMIRQMKSLGFTAVRVPFCPGTLRGVTPTSISYAINPDLQGLNSLQVLDKILTELDRQGMYILMDHATPDCAAISPLWYTASYSEQQWLADLRFVADRYKHLERFLGIDLKNEPFGGTWGTGNASTDWNKAAERGAAAVLSANPKLLVFVEGLVSNPSCMTVYANNWGGSFEPMTCTPLNIPKNKLVLSPHTYGPDVYMLPPFSAPDFPANMPAIWDKQFGSFASQGYTVIHGEFGGKYGHGGSPLDKVWQDAFVTYLKNKGINKFFYWSWNANSGDTGGILKDDWTAVWDDKVALLRRIMGDAPPPAPPPPPNLGVSVTIGNSWPGGHCANLAVTNQGTASVDWVVTFPIQGVVTSLWNGTYTQSGDKATVRGLDWNRAIYPGQTNRDVGFCANVATAPPAPPPPSAVAGAITINNDWGGGYCANLTVTNTSSTSVEWYVALPVQGRVTSLWNGVHTQSGTVLTVSGASWNKVLGAGQRLIDIGFCASRS